MTLATPRGSRTASLVLVAALLFICLATLIPQPEPMRATSPWCLVCGELGGIDVLQNVVLFIPLGAAFSMRSMAFPRAIALAFALTLAIELLQISVVTGRDASLSDVVTNTTGAALGYLGARNNLLSPKPRQARAIALGVAALWLFTLGLTVWALRPAPEASYFGWWRPGPPLYQPFRGELRAVTVQGQPVPRTELSRIGPYSFEFPLSLTHLEAVFTPGTYWPLRLAPIVLVHGVPNEGAMIARDRDDLMIRFRLNASLLRLRVPALVVRGVFMGVGPDSEMKAVARLTRPAITLGLETAGIRSTARLPLTPISTWTFLIRSDSHFIRGRAWPGVLWVAAWGVLLGWYAEKAYRSSGRRKTGALLTGVVFAGLPALTAVLGGTSLPAAFELAAAFGGVGVGWVIGVGWSSPAGRVIDSAPA